MARKRGKHHEDHIDETWLIPYADMLTLLLALFIVLFAVSSVDAEKYQQVMISFNQNLQGGTGVMEYPQPMPESTVNPEDSDVENMRAQERLQLEELKVEIDKYIEDNNLGSELQTNLSSNGLLLTILDNAIFYSGSAEVHPEARRLAEAISGLLVSDPPRQIVVAGHTDDVPINNEEYRSNWDLSSDRALNFMKILLENDQLNPGHLSATSYGEYHPVASNETSEGREQNRRVEVYILPNYSLE
ncbi:flagellar motor protein MotB [Halalkalibacter nanhaiisediminis]|uniref:Chemotaxis protein MotB n=1 Tax=Halalkalibacter nanhaiisediminis TaxID=688079 RepID=A0A562QTE1_9BACI|nr:flagellar motor protein MotB [Halalkalibacter nanhaiisediminis]TWI59977.1 chemotaxis protein MotB [Halalkalibacter nanhaiisediminis]